MAPLLQTKSIPPHPSEAPHQKFFTKFFPVRVVRPWNRKVVEGSNPGSMKVRLDGSRVKGVPAHCRGIWTWRISKVFFNLNHPMIQAIFMSTPTAADLTASQHDTEVNTRKAETCYSVWPEKSCIGLTECNKTSEKHIIGNPNIFSHNLQLLIKSKLN